MALLVRHFGAAALSAENEVLSLAAGITGIGLWRLLPWARNAVIVFSLLTILSGTEQVFEQHSSHLCHSVDLIGVLVCCVILVYFWRPKIRQVFQPTLPTVPVQS